MNSYSLSLNKSSLFCQKKTKKVLTSTLQAYLNVSLFLYLRHLVCPNPCTKIKVMLSVFMSLKISIQFSSFSNFLHQNSQTDLRQPTMHMHYTLVLILYRNHTEPS